VQPDGHGTLIGGGSNALRGVSGAIASIDRQTAWIVRTP
jgi:preprotein translocase subunit SecG